MMRQKTLEEEEKDVYCLSALGEIAPDVCLLIQAAADPAQLAKLSEILYVGLQEAIQDRYQELARAAAL